MMRWAERRCDVEMWREVLARARVGGFKNSSFERRAAGWRTRPPGRRCGGARRETRGAPSQRPFLQCARQRPARRLAWRRGGRPPLASSGLAGTRTAKHVRRSRRPWGHAWRAPRGEDAPEYLTQLRSSYWG
eukprot:scaffold518_cov388-Prasinococcus_capsulatus_cf.AAC.21